MFDWSVPVNTLISRHAPISAIPFVFRIYFIWNNYGTGTAQGLPSATFFQLLHLQWRFRFYTAGTYLQRIKRKCQHNLKNHFSNSGSHSSKDQPAPGARLRRWGEGEDRTCPPCWRPGTRTGPHQLSPLHPPQFRSSAINQLTNYFSHGHYRTVPTHVTEPKSSWTCSVSEIYKQCCGSASRWCGPGFDWSPCRGSGFWFFYVDPDPTFHPDGYPDPNFQIKAQT